MRDGAACLGLMSKAAFEALFGLAVLLAVALSALGLRVEISRATMFLGGALSGFMGTLTSIGSPPMAIVYQNARGARMRATLNAFFVAGSIISIAALAVAGGVGLSDLTLAFTMVPFALFGFLFSGIGNV